ncbi:MAG: 50S ribosomal protein L3 [Candidatus Omnitrophica bacterium]|nr:50S ribosomal protein L3 [Candidatus Omnitrophota bacterium]
MISGLLGKKIGMTQIFDKEGNVVPVTALEVGPCYVVGLKDSPRKKVVLGFDEIKESKCSKPRLGFFKKVAAPPLRTIQEFLSSDNAGYTLGQQLKADVFKPGEYVTVVGTSIGKGFQGGIKRWNWHGGDAGHGSMHHRRIGSNGANTYPGRVLRGKNMPGHMGDDQVTVQNLRVMQVDVDNNMILVKGAVPGCKNGLLTVEKSLKKAYRALDEKKEVIVHKKNPMKQAKAAAKGKSKK